jgi:hypothetical protein
VRYWRETDQSCTPQEPAQCQAQNAMWSWFMVWDSFIQKVAKTLLKNVYTSDLVLTLDKMPKWSALVSEK